VAKHLGLPGGLQAMSGPAAGGVNFVYSLAPSQPRRGFVQAAGPQSRTRRRCDSPGVVAQAAKIVLRFRASQLAMLFGLTLTSCGLVEAKLARAVSRNESVEAAPS
jgi:hypothetical protein